MTPNKVFGDSEMLSVLQSANSILLCTHIAPDGDAIGSTLAMGHALRAMGKKKITFACADPIPSRYHFLPGAAEFVDAQALKEDEFEVGFAIDAADLGRLGECAHAFSRAKITMQIDHHGTNPCYAEINAVDENASASGCMIYRVLKALGAVITPGIAQCLYCAISTDTGNFCFQNTNEEAFFCTAELMAAGLPLNETARMLHLIQEEKHIRLLGRALNHLRLFADGKCACLHLLREDFLAVQAGPEHCDKIVNYALNLPGVEMAYLADERREGLTHVSLRAQPPRNVAEIAKKFGGGGHVLAAGCKCPIPIEEVCVKLEKEMLAQIEETK